jgi:tRNA(Ile)-lysidine synthase TilS/MesJ
MYNNWEEEKSQKEKELQKIIQQVKKLNRKYNCFISLSGGKDSTYALYLFSKIYKLKCLCVTFDNGLMSEHAKSNIKKAIEITQSDHIYYNVPRNRLLNLF